MESIGIVLSTIAANMRTEGLLEQSQLLTAELQAQQEELKKTNDRLELQAASLRQSEELLRSKQDELQQTNAELEDKAVLLSAQNKQVEAKNTEVEQAKAALEEKAEQLALTSKYKSEFLANMSHELRTPLNSLLILSKMLSENAQGNLSAKQVEFARNIHSAGADLLGLINDILDLSKIESGTVTLDIGEMSFASLRDQTDRTFSQLAQDKKLDFFVNIDPALPRSMYTDDKRLQQVIKNLLSNAFKFTQAGSVRLSIARAEDGWAWATTTSTRPARCWPSRSRTPASAFPRTSSGSSSRPSSRPTAPPAASTAARAWACRSAARSPACWAASCGSSRRRARAAPSPSICR
jgi:signal transduction histidine kinase